MDNFMDKLAQKYNAQEMIRANAQAEASEMQRLQEQVAAYEGILQDMRKLNYKNSELTDRIYALVDESNNINEMIALKFNPCFICKCNIHTNYNTFCP